MIGDILRSLNMAATVIGWPVMLFGLACFAFRIYVGLRDGIWNWRRRLRERRCERWWREKKRSAAYHQMLDDMWAERDLHVARHYDSVDHLLETLR